MLVYPQNMPQRPNLPSVCIALGFPGVEALLEHAELEVESGETFLELRLDYLPQPLDAIEPMRRFLKKHPDVTVLATCRRHQNHGRFNGSVDEQIRVLEACIRAGARAVDVEIESAESCPELLESLRETTMLVVSFHNFTGTPALDIVVRRMTKIPADGYKIVTTARKPSDNYRVLSLAKTNPRAPVILLAMGEVGLPTRILSTAFGGLYTYAAPNAAEGTAPGQIAARTLRNLYRIEKFTKAARIYGVIADPVRHSISPAVHNRAFQSRRIDAVYLPFLVHPVQLKDMFLLAEKLPVAGFSVTIPHKQKVLRYVDTLDPLSRRIGAINTVWRKAGRWRGTNTDVAGVLGPLKRHLNIPKSSFLVVGNGGAARGAAFALADAGAKVFVVARNPDRARALGKACGGTALLREQTGAMKFDAVVHATPLGMHPHTEATFFPNHIPADLVFDMVYNPLETVLLRHARQEGKQVVTGLEMFLEQAARQFEAWTGESAPRPAMERAALEALANRDQDQIYNHNQHFNQH